MPKTEVILTHNIVGLGGESDQVKVAAGYARNYLFPMGYAIPLSGANKRRLEALKQRRAEREAKELNHMTEMGAALSKMTLLIKVKTGEDGKMFGSVTATKRRFTCRTPSRPWASTKSNCACTPMSNRA
jgi:large subunit ribosomal protein L9